MTVDVKTFDVNALETYGSARLVGCRGDHTTRPSAGSWPVPPAPLVAPSLPTWLVLLTLQTQQVANQRELAAGVGIQGATLTHHLNAMESAGLLTRRRDPANRRVHLVELTERGEAAFHRMREAAAGFDQQLRAGLEADEIAHLSLLLARLRDNVNTDNKQPEGPGNGGSGINA